MKDGRFEKEGTISDLKKEHGGFNIKLKLVNKGGPKDLTREISVTNSNDSEEGYDEVDSVAVVSTEVFNTIDELKDYFKDKYNGTVKDEHSGLLHIYVEDKTKRWSTIFKEVERLKKINPHLIEDYAISEASLEDIFLTVARSKSTVKEKKLKKSRKVKAGAETV